ncbi:lipase family protein [Clostridium sp. DSM 8431]|uniref:lipase family protein n=1 Tax=Clostridium sp. DSM 8431 TaxID=1761781 RepID=UPI001FA92396|nr:lipase family protein [Clostridium sp. DSM 8431]
MERHWYGRGDVAEKYVEGQSNPYFDSSKPTVIVFYEWQNNSTKQLHRITFNSKNNNASLGIDNNLADYWIDNGWNIGIFYWNQFVDEGEVKNAEKKVWSNNTSIGLRWRKVDGSYEAYSGSKKSVAEMFIKDYESCMKNFKGTEIRFVGHSLGNQLATNSAKLVENDINSSKISSKLRPNRIALLDPFWSKGGKDYLGGRWTGEVCREYIKELESKGVAVEMYRSSSINDLFIGDSNEEMRKITAYAEIYPDFVSSINQMAKHCYGKEWYIYSKGVNLPLEYFNKKLTDNIAPSASTPTWKIKQMMNSGYYWTQKDGKKTASPEDDSFNKIAW